MRININLPDPMVEIIDKRAKALFMSRSAFIASCVSRMMSFDDFINANLPELLKVMQKTEQKIIENEVTSED